MAAEEGRTVAFQREEIAVQPEQSGPSHVFKLVAVEASQEVASICVRCHSAIGSDDE